MGRLKSITQMKFRILAISLALSFIAIGISAAVDDGFGSAKKIEGQYFTIFYSPELDLTSLTQQLNIRPSDEILTGTTTEGNAATSPELASMIDTLYLRVGDILDMHVYSFTGTIKVCKDDEQIERIYKNLFDKSLHHQKSFYVYSLNTIYISSSIFKKEVLGHEIAHAIINRYFVVPSPIKIQEVLSMYVEYQLRKE